MKDFVEKVARMQSVTIKCCLFDCKNLQCWEMKKDISSIRKTAAKAIIHIILNPLPKDAATL